MLKYFVLRGYLKRPFVHLILIAALGLVVYSNTFDVPFQWDDKSIIAENPVIKNPSYFLNPSEAKGFGVHYINLRDRYVGYLTFAVNYRLHGLDVRGYHVVNIALHILNAFLVYFLARLTFKTPFMERASLKEESPYIALFVGLFFVSHPIQTEAVTYIMGRLPLLMSFFYLSSVVLYVKWRLTAERESNSPSSPPLNLRGGRGALYFASLLSAVLAMKTKENAFTLPFAIAMYEFLFFNTNSLKRRISYILPFMITLPIIPICRMFAPGNGLSDIYSLTEHGATVPRLSYLLTQFRVLVTYLRLLVFPVNQNADYDFPVYDSFNFELTASFALILIIFSVAVYMLSLSKKKPGLRIVSFGILWFFLTISVESSILPIAMIISEYRAYMPSAGIFMAILTGGSLINERLKTARLNTLLFAAMFLILPVLAFTAYARNTVWKTEISLWEDVVKKSPKKERAHINLGVAYNAEGQAEKAIEQFGIALQLAPDYDIHYNLGNVYLRSGDVDRAIAEYETALKIKPDYAKAHINLGLAFMEKEQVDSAIVHYLRASKLDSGNAAIPFNMGIAYQKIGAIDEAINQFKFSLELAPENADANYNLGIIFISKGMFDEGIEHYRMAIKANSNHEKARLNLALVYIENGLIEKARNELAVLLKINPDNNQARIFMYYISSPIKNHPR